jgi:3-oxoacyl-[acyl-carrier protein] reductase
MISIDLSGKTAIVTGAGQGLGAAVAQTLHQAGANVIINYFKDPQGINEPRAQAVAQQLGRCALAVEADIRNPQSVEAMFVKAAEVFGHVDIVINNAGIIRDKTIKKMTSEDWQSVIDTNLTGTFNVCRAAAEKLSDGGRIVNFASISGVVGFFGQSNYSAAKAGVIALTKVLSKEVGKRKITVNAVAPGVVLTEMGKTIPEEVRAEMLKSVPLGRFGEASEIASVVLFLCSGLASYVTGQTVHVNGGWIG